MLLGFNRKLDVAYFKEICSKFKPDTYLTFKGSNLWEFRLLESVRSTRIVRGTFQTIRSGFQETKLTGFGAESKCSGSTTNALILRILIR